MSLFRAMCPVRRDVFEKLGRCFFLSHNFLEQDLRRNASLSCSALQIGREVLDDVGAIPARHFCRARSCVGTIMRIISRNITP